MYGPDVVPTNPWYDRFFKIISITGFFLILGILILIVYVGPASSFEFSIYDAYPWYFWVFLLSAILCGQIVIFGSAITQSKKNYWLFGLCAILISNALLLFMPIIRGYFSFDEGDVLTHIGYMKDILQTSSIGGNHYPIDHILGVIIHLFVGLTLQDITLIIPLFFSFFFILALYLVGKTIFQNKFELLILIILSTILIFGNFHYTFTPNSQALFLVPIILFLALKMYLGENKRKYNLILLLISMLIVFYHPLVAVMVIVILFLMQTLQAFLDKYENRIFKKVNYTYTILFIIAVFSIWSSYLAMATYYIRPIIGRIFGDETVESELQKNINLISQVQADPMYVIKLIFNLYGHSIIIAIMSLLCITLIVNSMKNQKTKPDFFIGIAITGFIIFSMLSIAMLFINGSFGFIRIYSVAAIFSLLLIPTGAYLFLYTNSKEILYTKKTIVKLFGVIFLVFCVTYFSTFSLFFSPIIKQANQQVPKGDYIGMSTFFSYRNDSLPVLELGPTSYRFYDALYGRSASRRNIFYFENANRMIPPDHFGYQNETLLGNFYSTSKYLVLNDRGREWYPNMLPEFKDKWRFLAQDFEQLKSDANIQKVYSNRDLEIFMIP